MAGGDRSSAESAGKHDAQNRNVDEAVDYLEHANNGSAESMTEVKEYVNTLHANMCESDYRQFIDEVYNRVYGDARNGLVANRTLPDLAINLNASDRQVDPGDNTGAADANFSDMPKGNQVTRLDENGQVSYTYAADNSSGMSFDSQGNAIAFKKGSQKDVMVTSSSPTGEVRTTDYTGVDPGTVNFNPDGSLTMDKVDRTRTGEYPYEATTVTGSITVQPGGQEITHNDKGNTTIVRDQAAGKITSYDSDASGQHVSFDGKTWTGLPGEVSTDANANPLAVQKGEHGNVLVTTISPSGELKTFDHTDVNADTIKTNPDGSVTMDRVDSNNNKVGTVTVQPGGQETTHIDNGNTTIVRDQSGGNISGYDSSANGKHVSFDGTTWTGLPGRTTNATTNPADVQIDSATGQISSYNTNDGVNVTLNANGDAIKYQNTNNTGADNQYSFEYHESDNAWYYHQTGGDYVHIDVPTVNENGTISSKENGGFNSGRQHSIEGAGQESGGTLLTGITKNVGYSLIDANVNAIPNIIGDLTGNEELSNWKLNLITPVDPEYASNAERAGGLIGSTLGLLSPGKVSKLSDAIGLAGDFVLNAGKQVGGNVKDNVKDDKSLNPLNDWNWYNWYTN